MEVHTEHTGEYSWELKNVKVKHLRDKKMTDPLIDSIIITWSFLLIYSWADI